MRVAQGDAGRQEEFQERIQREVARILRKAGLEFPADDPREAELAALERRVQRVLRQVGSVLLTAFSAQAAACLAERPCCKDCGEAMVVRHRYTVTKTGLVGDVTLTQTEYGCKACGTRDVPTDELLKAGPGGLTPELTRVTAAACAEIPSFERAAATVGEVLGIRLATRTAMRAAEAIGHVAEGELQAKMAEVAARAGASKEASCERTEVPAPLPEDAPTILVGADGARAFVDRDWREVKIGVACQVGPTRHHDRHTGRDPLVLGPRQYVAGVEEADTFFDRLTVCVDEIRDRLDAPLRILMIGDGGPWIWARSQVVASAQDEVHEILDLFHAGEHLGEVAKAVFPNEHKAKAWTHDLITRLRDEGPDPVFDALRALNPRGRTQKKIVRLAIAYFETNRDRMDYPTYAARGWPLGSGIVESTCRLVSNLRTKEPGMRWSYGGVQAILTLRAVRLSHEARWDHFWQTAPQTKRPAVRTLTRHKFPDPKAA